MGGPGTTGPPAGDGPGEGYIVDLAWPRLVPQPAELSDVTENYEEYRDLLWLLSPQPSRDEMWFCKL